MFPPGAKKRLHCVLGSQKTFHNWTVCNESLFFFTFNESHTICIIYHVMFFSLALPFWMRHCQNRCDRYTHAFTSLSFVGKGGTERLIMWHYKEANLFEVPLSWTSRHQSEGMKIVFHSECTSQGHERDTWKWEHVEGSLPAKSSVPTEHQVYGGHLLRPTLIW